MTKPLAFFESSERVTIYLAAEVAFEHLQHAGIQAEDKALVKVVDRRMLIDYFWLIIRGVFFFHMEIPSCEAVGAIAVVPATG
jgi:hypothetical protein